MLQMEPGPHLLKVLVNPSMCVSATICIWLKSLYPPLQIYYIPPTPFNTKVIFQVVFLNRGEPDLEFEGLLKREKTRVTYFQGTMLKYVGLDAEDGVDVEVVVEVDVYVVIVIVVVISSIAVC